MAGYKAKWTKTNAANEVIRICQDTHHAWFVERQKDRDQHLNPLGGFSTLDFAKLWADDHYPGGEWEQV